MSSPICRLLAAVAVLLSGCTTLQPSMPYPGAGEVPGSACVALQPGLPAQLPKDAVPFPQQAPYLLIPADSAVGLLVPLPFVSEWVGDAIAKSDAAGYQAHIGHADVYAIANQALAERPRLTAGCRGAGSQARLQAFVFVLEGHDELYRLTLVFHLQAGTWVGRYHEHLPTPLPKSELKSLSPERLAAFRQELGDGARLLTGLLERDVQGRLPAQGAKVEVGSLYLIGGNVAGLVAPERLHFRNNDLLEEQGDDLILRLKGDMQAPGQSGALLFGVHHFRKPQLHFFRRQ